MITRTRGAVLSAVVCAALTSACTSPAPPPTTVTVTVPPSTTTTAAPTTRSEDSIVGSGYSAVCKGRGFTDAAAYTGAGPHPIAISVSAAKGGAFGLEVDLTSDVATLPEDWEAGPNTDLQLVACVKVVEVKPVRECEYRTIGSTAGRALFSARLFHRVLQVQVRATRTGEPVGKSTTVTTGAAACAGSSEQPQSGSNLGPHQYGTLTDAQRDTLFRALVTATV